MEAKTPTDRPKRNRRTFSLRTLLLTVTIAALIFGWTGAWHERARRQRELIDRLQHADAEVYYDYMVEKSGAWIATNRRPSPELGSWRESFGDDFFHSVGAVRFFSAEIKDDDLAILEELPRLQLVSIRSASVTDRAIMHLVPLRDLQLLELSGGQIHDAGARQIGRFCKLVGLNLSDTLITDRALPDLIHLDRLETLLLRFTAVSDEGLSAIAKMSSLRELDLDGTQVTDVKLPELKSLTHLERLTISGDRVSDGVGIAELTRLLPNLKISLLFDRDGVSPRMLALQEQVPNLRLLHWKIDRWTELRLSDKKQPSR